MIHKETNRLTIFKDNLRLLTAPSIQLGAHNTSLEVEVAVVQLQGRRLAHDGILEYLDLDHRNRDCNQSAAGVSEEKYGVVVGS